MNPDQNQGAPFLSDMKSQIEKKNVYFVIDIQSLSDSNSPFKMVRIIRSKFTYRKMDHIELHDSCMTNHIKKVDLNQFDSTHNFFLLFS